MAGTEAPWYQGGTGATWHYDGRAGGAACAACDAVASPSTPASWINSEMDFSRSSIREPMSSIRLMMESDMVWNRPCISLRRFCTKRVRSWFWSSCPSIADRSAHGQHKHTSLSTNAVRKRCKIVLYVSILLLQQRLWLALICAPDWPAPCFKGQEDEGTRRTCLRVGKDIKRPDLKGKSLILGKHLTLHLLASSSWRGIPVIQDETSLNKPALTPNCRASPSSVKLLKSGQQLLDCIRERTVIIAKSCQIHICHTLGHTVCLFRDFPLPSGIYKVRTACGIPLVHTSPIYSHIKYVILFSVFPSSFSHILNPNRHVNSDQLTCVRIPTYLSSFAQTHTCIDLYIHLLSRCTSGFILID